MSVPHSGRRPQAVAALVLTLLAVGRGPAQKGQGGIEYTSGRPWTATVPNPDQFDWSRTDRPGYHFRGMLPSHQRFYEYIKAKRQTPGGLSWADQMMIRRLTALRRWPEAPRPNPFWTAYLQYLRRQPTTDLNLAQRLMLAELFARGLAPLDNPGDENTKRLADYLNSGPFEARNWFERTFGRVEPWISYELAATGHDMGKGSAPSGVYPVDGTFNGLRIWYNVTGATLGPAKDAGGFTTTRSHEGTINPNGTLTVTGRYSVGGFGADITATVWADAERKEYKFYLKQTKTENPYTSEAAYSVSVPIPAHCKQGGFSVRLDGRYSMGGGHRGLIVSGTLKQSAADKAQEQAAEDAKWRAEVERTLRDLGYEETPVGREVKAMRDALHQGDAGWKAYVDRRQRELGYDTTPDGQRYAQVKEALVAGGDTWNNQAGKDLGGQPLPPAARAPADAGGVEVGPPGQPGGPAAKLAPLPKVSGALPYKDLPKDTTVTIVWVRDGQELGRSNQRVGGSGRLTSTIGAKQGNLVPGGYSVSFLVGDKVLGRRSFLIATPGRQPDL